nr:hypothetical protein [Brucella pituitosa]
MVRAVAEAGIWGSVRHHGLLGNAVIISDDAGQFRVGNHALCWVHAERLLQKLMPATPQHVRWVPEKLYDRSRSLEASTRRLKLHLSAVRAPHPWIKISRFSGDTV